eukprot:6124332-Prymnesium_polylepis.3
MNSSQIEGYRNVRTSFGVERHGGGKLTRHRPQFRRVTHTQLWRGVLQPHRNTRTKKGWLP